MDSVADILADKKFTPPDEMALVKDFVERRYKSRCRIKIEHNTLILSVYGSTLATTIRLEQQRLIESCGLTKKLVIRAGR